MSWSTALRSALQALAANTLRSMLTMLGIIIGVAAVITMVAVGNGATQRVQEQMKGLGSNIMLVLPGGVSQSGVRLGAQTRQRLTEEDAQAIGYDIPQVQVAAPTSRASGQLVFGNTNWGTTIMGVTNDYLDAREWPLASGRVFDAAEMAGSAKVAWIGATVARELFGDGGKNLVGGNLAHAKTAVGIAAHARARQCVGGKTSAGQRCLQHRVARADRPPDRGVL